MRQDHTRPEVTSIIREVLKEVSHQTYTKQELKVLTALKRCRTAELGGHLTICKNCDYREQSYNSCLNRHCPKCKGGKVFSWIESRRKELLPVKYFHIVFTIPSELRQVFYQNKRRCYDLLFKASSEALNATARTKHKAELGYFGIIHTWNQEVQYHPHIHYVIPAVGITKEGSIRIGTDKFILPVKVLSKIFQGKLIDYLKRSHCKGRLKFFGNITHLENTKRVQPKKSSRLAYQGGNFNLQERILDVY